MSFLRCLAEIGKVEYANDDEKTGLEILRKALEEPLKWILINAGKEPSEMENRLHMHDEDWRICPNVYYPGAAGPEQ